LEENVKPRKVIATVALGNHVEFLELSIENLKLYAAKYGYELEICKKNLDPKRPEAWSKILFILELMNNYDEIFWIDSDAIIIDFTTDLQDELLPETDLAWVYHSYENQSHPNSGVMYIRVNSKTIKFFQTVNMQADLDFHPWGDQAAMMRILGQDSILHPIGSGDVFHQITLQEQRISNEWNSVRLDAAYHVRIRHFAGDSTSVRKLFLAEYANPRGRSLEQLNLSLLIVSDSENEINRLKEQLAAASSKIRDSENEINLLKKQLDAVLNSKTWKFFSLWRQLRKFRN
jgi:hypothetical protein